MTATGVFIAAGGVLLAGTLLCAGISKLALPGHLSRAIGELVPAVKARAVAMTRLVATAEVGAGLALSVPVARAAGAVAAAVLGAMFATAGGVAAVRGLGAPCGCFGRAGERPLGVRNIAFGLGLVALSAVLFLGDGGGWAPRPELPLLGMNLVALVLAAWVHRDMIKELGPFMGSAHRVP